MIHQEHSTVADYKQRMTVHEWMKLVMEGKDSVQYLDSTVPLRAVKLGFGIVEVGK